VPAIASTVCTSNRMTAKSGSHFRPRLLIVSEDRRAARHRTHQHRPAVERPLRRGRNTGVSALQRYVNWRRTGRRGPRTTRPDHGRHVDAGAGTLAVFAGRLGRRPPLSTLFRRWRERICRAGACASTNIPRPSRPKSRFKKKRFTLIGLDKPSGDHSEAEEGGHSSGVARMSRAKRRLRSVSIGAVLVMIVFIHIAEFHLCLGGERRHRSAGCHEEANSEHAPPSEYWARPS
jgi:hypothetical protein